MGDGINMPLANVGVTLAAINEVKQQLYINTVANPDQISVVDLNDISHKLPPIQLPALGDDYYNNLIVNANGDINICTQQSCTIYIILSENIPA
ncbi:hypothetical protein D3C73_1469440 [compost metagenome]